MSRAAHLSEAQGGKTAIRIWDLPTRLVHWMLAALVGLSWFTGKSGAMAWHRWSGYAVLTLVLFRIYWGFVGSSTARFSHFLRGPGVVWSHAKTLFKRLSGRTVGHNPLGGWSIMVMLLLLLLQTGLGLFAVDVDGIESGPLADLVSFDEGRRIALWHGKVVDILLFFIALHLSAVVYHGFYKRENLVIAMLTGNKSLPPSTEPAISFVTLWRAVMGLAVIALLMVALITRLQF